MKRTSLLKNINEPLYNSRLIKNYVVYIEKYYPEIEIDSILSYAYINKYELNDNGHWFSQWQVDRFHTKLSRATKNPNISREVGRYMASTDASDPLKNYVMGFMSPAAAYWVLGKLSSHLSRAFSLKIKRMGQNKIEVSSTPNPGVNEKTYQCENRIGIFEAIAKMFTNKYANVDHPTCVHKGGNVCKYIITWENTHSLIRRYMRFYFVPVALISIISLYLLNPPVWYAGMVLVLATFVAGVAIYAEKAEKKDLVQYVKDQSNAAKLLLDEINRRYNDSLLVKEIGQATSNLLNINDLLFSVTESMEKLLDYDRGGIWLADSKKMRLVYKVGYGYEREIESLLRGAEFHLDNSNSKGVAVQAFRKQRPYLVNDIKEIENDLTARSLEFLRKTRAHSFICVPLVYERKSFGILFVDNLKSKRNLSQSDVSLLVGISRQIAISINNAMSYQKLEASKEREKNIRKLFESYVPPTVIRRYVSETDLFKGEDASITALFLDLRGFTSSMEKMKVEDVVSFLNDYFEKCSHIIGEEHGHINKYTGDGFLAIFGAPEPIENHAAMSFNAACKILELSGRLFMGDMPIEIGIGIHTGKAILGNLGSRTKMEYTAIGNTVNTAARLQELTKLFQEFSIIISRDVLDRVHTGHPYYKRMINLGPQEIRGKKYSLEVFGLKAHAKDDFRSNQDDLMEGLEPMQVISGV